MTKYLLPLFSLILSFSLIAQEDNELHAIFIKKEPITSVWQGNVKGSSAHLNINISGNEAPQNEPSVCISRTNPDIVVAAWRDFRLGYLEPDVVRRIGYSYSTDGGQTWAESQLLPDPNPDHISQSDPVLACDMDGNFYLSSTSRQPVQFYNREMLLYKSTDNGQTFFLHDIAVPGSGWQGEDKEWIYVDPFQSNPTYNHLMIAWRSFGPSYGIKFRKSDPGGGNWSETVDVGDTDNGQGANLTTDNFGKIIVVWAENGIKYDISYDGGSTFSQDRTLSGYSYNINNSFPFIKTDNSGTETDGNVYVVWADARSGSDDVWFQRSTDGGETWLGQPVRVNDETQYNQYWPVVTVGSDGRVFVLYYDERQAPGVINAYLAFSDDAGDSWFNTRLSDFSFPGNQPNSNVRFGDYIQVDAFQDRIVPVWTDDRNGNYDQEIFTAVVDLSVSVDELSRRNDKPGIIQNTPNPFNEQTTISVHLSEAAASTVEIFNVTGQLLDVLYKGSLSAGIHHFNWGSEVVPGVYICRVRAGGYEEQLKMIRTN